MSLPLACCTPSNPELVRWPGMLLIGAAARDAGKTRLATSVIRRAAARGPVLAAKVTVIRTDGPGGCPRGGAGCGVCTSLDGRPYILTEEHGAEPHKDTARMLAAGASRVFWLRVAEPSLPEGRDVLQAALGTSMPVVCESNTFRRAVDPDLFLVMQREGTGWMKPSCRAVLADADRVVHTRDGGADYDAPEPDLVDGRWRLRHDATAVVLAGGRSLRMGRDKALLEIDGRPLIERLIRGLEPHFAEVLISARRPDDYAFLGCRVIADPVTGQGPMRGVTAALQAARHERVFFTPCDQADVPLDLAARLLRRLGDADVAVPRHPDGKVEPLLAVLRRRLAPTLERALDRGERRVLRAYEQAQVRFVDLPDHVGVTNLNTRADYLEALALRGALPPEEDPGSP